MKHAKILYTGKITKTKLYWFADIIQERKDRYEPGDFTKMDLYNWWKFPIEKMKYLAEHNNSFIILRIFPQLTLLLEKTLSLRVKRSD